MVPSTVQYGLLATLSIVIALATDLTKCCAQNVAPLRVSTFDVDVTPPIGYRMAYDPVRRLDEIGLRARGVVIIGSEQPIVLCSVDWIGIANQAHDIFREEIALAANTSSSNVALHTIHQHDAPVCDFGAEDILRQRGVSDLGPYDGSFARDCLKRICKAVSSSICNSQEITHVGFGASEVIDVASNRRIVDESTGKVKITRYTATKDADVRALPVGTIDPELSCISFWSREQCLAALTYYACHPQSYYRMGIPSPDFPGLARFAIGQEFPDTLFVHFNGAGGNIGAGKYNDGSKGNRMVLANRTSDAMRQAFNASTKIEVQADSVRWLTEKVRLPVSEHLDESKLLASIDDENTSAARPDQLAWLYRSKNEHETEIQCLSIGNIRILHMPGELFVEYQLAAKAMRPDLFIAMAAYGDYGPGYIGTEIAYAQGGYETEARSSNVAPAVEQVLMNSIRNLLK